MTAPPSAAPQDSPALCRAPGEASFLRLLPVSYLSTTVRKGVRANRWEGFTLGYLLHACSATEEEIPLSLSQQPLLAHDLNAEHEAVDELVLLEKPPGNIGVCSEQGLLQEDGQAVLQIVGLLGSFDRCVEQLRKKESFD